MPSHVRIFFWLGVCAVLYSVLSTAWFLTFPTQETIAVMARLPPAFRALTQHVIVRNTIFVTAFWAIIPLVLLWLAAFRRQNWARWGYVALFAFHKIVPWVVALAYFRRVPHAWDFPLHDWSEPAALVSNALILVTIAFAFTGNARDWFRRSARRAVAA
jgi:hypothetical protein